MSALQDDILDAVFAVRDDFKRLLFQYVKNRKRGSIATFDDAKQVLMYGQLYDLAVRFAKENSIPEEKIFPGRFEEDRM